MNESTGIIALKESVQVGEIFPSQSQSQSHNQIRSQPRSHFTNHINILGETPSDSASGVSEPAWSPSSYYFDVTTPLPPLPKRKPSAPPAPLALTRSNFESRRKKTDIKLKDEVHGVTSEKGQIMKRDISDKGANEQEMDFISRQIPKLEIGEKRPKSAWKTVFDRASTKRKDDQTSTAVDSSTLGTITDPKETSLRFAESPSEKGDRIPPPLVAPPVHAKESRPRPARQHHQASTDSRRRPLSSESDRDLRRKNSDSALSISSIGSVEEEDERDKERETMLRPKAAPRKGSKKPSRHRRTSSLAFETSAWGPDSTVQSSPGVYGMNSIQPRTILPPAIIPDSSSTGSKFRRLLDGMILILPLSAALILLCIACLPNTWWRARISVGHIELVGVSMKQLKSSGKREMVTRGCDALQHEIYLGTGIGKRSKETGVVASFGIWGWCLVDVDDES